MNKLHLLLCAGLASIFVACDSPTTAPSYGNALYFIEGEDMTPNNPDNWEVVEGLPDSISGQKAIKLLDSSAYATYEIFLPQGTYLANAYVTAIDGEHDAVYLACNDVSQRIITQKYDPIWRYSMKVLPFSVKESGMQTIKVAVTWPGKDAAETGMVIDKIEIIPLDASAETLKKWRY